MVSIIVPVYKSKDTLKRCVESLLAQTVEDTEMILVDDGSPDGSGELCDKLAEEDSRIRVIHKENGGVSSARNVGIEAAKGNYLLFADSDDYVEQDMVEKLLGGIGNDDIAICGFHHHYQGRDIVRIPEVPGQSGEENFLALYGEGFLNMPWNKLYRAELFKETGIRYPEGRIHEDEATTYRLFHEAKKLAFLDRALYGYYTENGGSITSVFSAKRLQWLTAHEERIAFFKKNGYEKLLPAAYRKLCDACITFYFRCTEQVKDAEELKKELRKRLETYRANGAAWIAALPLKTRMGYELFSMSPGLYAKMLQKMQETS